MDAALSNNTHLSYESTAHTFQSFRRTLNLPLIWPVPVNHITLFIAHNYERNASPSTVRTYLSGLGYKHKLENMPDPTKAFIVTKMLEGYSRLDRRNDVRLPITLQMLSSFSKTLAYICSSNYEQLLFKAAYFIAFFGLFRVGELVFTSPAYASRPLMLDDVTFEGNGTRITITVRQSKCDQRGISETVNINQHRDPNLCPVRALHCFLQQRPNSSQYLFIHVNGQPLTRYQFSAILAKCVRFVGLPEARFKSHSFRIGGASYLADMNVADDVIRKLGRWKSDSFRSYLR